MESRHSREAVHTIGRGVTVLLAVFAASGLERATLTWTLASALIWLASIQVAFAPYGGELHSLGRSLAAIHGVALGFVGSLAASAIMPATNGGVWRLVLLSLAIFALILAWESVYRRWIARPSKIIIVGLDNAGVTIARELDSDRRPPYWVAGYVADAAHPNRYPGSVWLGDVSSLPEILARERPTIVVLAVGQDRPSVFARLLEASALRFRVVEAAQFCEHAFGRVPVRDITRAWFMSVLHLYQRPYSRFAKRTFDIVGALLGIILFLPLMLVLAPFLLLSRGPVLFRQTRIGEHGKPFTIYKLRTMTVDAEEPGKPRWAEDRDPRTTRVGRVIRRLRLDEIPQILNVLQGDMSIVGPRPERPEFMEYLEQRVPFWSRRHLVKPGITGWAQVCRGYTTDAEGSVDKLSYDLWYLRHRSLTVDLAICLQTVAVVLTGTRTKHPHPRDAAAESPEGSAETTRLLPVTKPDVMRD